MGPALQARLRKLQDTQKMLAATAESARESGTRAISGDNSAIDANVTTRALADVATEAGRLAEQSRLVLERQFSETTANTATVRAELEAIQREKQPWATEMAALQGEHAALQSKLDQSVASLKGLDQVVRDLKTKRGSLRIEFERIEFEQARLVEERSQVQSKTVLGKKDIEESRNMAWDELGGTKEALFKASLSMQQSATEHERRQRELMSLVVAHSKFIAQDAKDGAERLRVKLPNPDSAQMSAALQAVGLERRLVWRLACYLALALGLVPLLRRYILLART